MQYAFDRLADAFIAVVFMFLFWRLQRACHCECERAAGRDSGASTGFLGAMQMLFGGVAGSAIIALGGADHFSVTATGLLIMALGAVLSSFLAPDSR